MDPHHFDADPDSTYHPDAGPEPVDPLFHFDADPDSTYHPDADPDSDVYLIWMRIRIRLLTLMRSDPDPSFQIKAQSLEKVLK